MTKTPVEIEADRLSSVVSLVFEGRHYHHLCNCDGCEETRAHLSNQDTAFINHISKIVRPEPVSANPRP